MDILEISIMFLSPEPWLLSIIDEYSILAVARVDFVMKIYEIPPFDFSKILKHVLLNF